MSNFTEYNGKKLDKSGVEAVPDDLSPNNSQSENSDYVLYTIHTIYITASTGLSLCFLRRPLRLTVSMCLIRLVFERKLKHFVSA